MCREKFIFACNVKSNTITERRGKKDGYYCEHEHVFADITEKPF